MRPPTHPPRARRGRRRGCRGPPFLSGCSSPRGPSCSPLHARAVFPGLPGCAGALQCWLRRLPLLVGGVVDGDASVAGEQVIHPIGAGFILSFPTARVVLVLLGRRRRRRVGAARQVRGLVVPVHTVHFVLVEVKKLPGSGPAAQQPGRSHRRRPRAAGGRGGAAASAAAARSRGGEAGALGAGLHRRAGGRGRHGRRLLQPPPSLAAAAVHRRGAGGGSGNQSGQQGRRGRRRRRRRGRGAAGAAAGRPEPHAAVAAGRGGGGSGVQRRGVKAEVVREAGAAPAPHALRGLPDLHPQRIRGAFLLGLDPGHAGIHPRPPASDPHGPARAPRRRPLTARRTLPRLSAPGPAAALDTGREQRHVSRGGGRAAGGGGQSRARPGERGSGGAEAAQTVPGPALPGALPSPFQCGVPLARARTGTAHAPQILNLHWRRPPWQPHMRAGRPGGRGQARRGWWEGGGRRTLGRLPLLRRARPPAHARPGDVGSVRKPSGGRRGFGLYRACAGPTLFTPGRAWRGRAGSRRRRAGRRGGGEVALPLGPASLGPAGGSLCAAVSGWSSRGAGQQPAAAQRRFSSSTALSPPCRGLSLWRGVALFPLTQKGEF